MSKRICYLCKKDVDNEFEMGEWKRDGIDVHYYCLLLTSNLIQKGEDSQGILGFLIKDIKIEVKRIKTQKCCFCHKPFAGIGCCAKKCTRTFHLSCGILNKCRNYFSGTYQSFCDKHHKINHRIKHETTTDCGICYDNMGKYHPLNSIQSACCKTGWFHKLCLQKFAKSAGYFFKCPLCNNTEEFRNDVMTHGVFVPDKDAEWETEPNAFAELLERAKNCEADDCLCPKSREFCDSEWEQIRCLTCGNSIHNKCIKDVTENYICQICCKSKIDSETIAALKALIDVESDSSDDEEDTSIRLAGSSQNVSSTSNSFSSRRTIFDYFSPGKPLIKTKPCKILLERLNLNDYLKSNECSDSDSSIRKKKFQQVLLAQKTKKRNQRISSETSDGSSIVKNMKTDLSSPLIPKLTKKWIELLNSTHDSDSEIEKINKKRATKRLQSESSETTSSSICPMKKRRKLNVNTPSPQLAGAVCNRRRSLRLISTDSSNKNTEHSSSASKKPAPVVTRRNSIRISALENQRKSVSPIFEDQIESSDSETLISSNSEIMEETTSVNTEIMKIESKIENNNNSQIESKKVQKNIFIDLDEIKRIKREMQSIDIIARRHSIKMDLFGNRCYLKNEKFDKITEPKLEKFELETGSIYAAKEHLKNIDDEINRKSEIDFSSTESENDIGINNVAEDQQTASNLNSTNEENDENPEKLYFKMKSKDISNKKSKRKSNEFVNKSKNAAPKKSPFKVNNDNKKSPKKSLILKMKAKFNKGAQTNRIDNYFTVKAANL